MIHFTLTCSLYSFQPDKRLGNGSKNCIREAKSSKCAKVQGLDMSLNSSGAMHDQ